MLTIVVYVFLYVTTVAVLMIVGSSGALVKYPYQAWDHGRSAVNKAQQDDLGCDGVEMRHRENARPVVLKVLHEFGHNLGLQHPGDTCNEK